MAKVGRPSTYNPNLDFARLAEDYLQTCGKEQTKLPKLSEFCREVLHISQDAVEDWLSSKIRKIKRSNKSKSTNGTING